jgi:hypothetical protein
MMRLFNHPAIFLLYKDKRSLAKTRIVSRSMKSERIKQGVGWKTKLVAWIHGVNILGNEDTNWIQNQIESSEHYPMDDR